MIKNSPKAGIIAGMMAAVIGFPPNTFARTYTVKERETLSQISKKELKDSRPVYGPGGKLEEVINLNPEIKNIHLIYKNDQILIEKETVKPDMPAQPKSVAPKAELTGESQKVLAPVKPEPVKPEPVKPEPVKAEPVKAEPVKAEPVPEAKTKRQSPPQSTDHRVGLNLILGDQRLQVFHSPIVADKTTLYSGLAYGIGLDWHAQWQPAISTDLSVEGVRTEFASAKDKSFTGKSDTLKGVAFGINGHMGQFRVGLSWEVAQEYLFTFDEKNQRASSVEAVAVDKAKAKIGYTAYQGKEQKVDVSGFVGQVVGGRGRTVEIDGRLTYGADAHYTYKLNKEFDVKAGLGFERSRYEIELDAQQAVVEFKATVGVGYSF